MTDSQAQDLIEEVRASNGLLGRLAKHLLDEQNVVEMPTQMRPPYLYAGPAPTETGEVTALLTDIYNLLKDAHHPLQTWIEHDMDRGAKLFKQGAALLTTLAEIHADLERVQNQLL